MYARQTESVWMSINRVGMGGRGGGCVCVCAEGGAGGVCRATDQNQGQLPAEKYVLLCCVTKWKSTLNTHAHAHTHTHTHILTHTHTHTHTHILTHTHTHVHTQIHNQTDMLVSAFKEETQAAI